jgi:uncharacterized protein (DUF1499 family)
MAEQPEAPTLGVRYGQLTACPDSPNCVSSQSADRRHYVPPIEYSGSLDNAKARLMEALDRSGKVSFTANEPTYVRCEFQTRLMNFVDDVECYLPEDEKVIHVRSASRVGRYDFGANRRRVERIRRTFHSIP